MAFADRDTERKRAERAQWPIVRFRLGDDPPEDLSAITTPGERIAMMWGLAEAAWKLARKPWPTYDRRHIPARLVRPGEARPHDDEP
ncbi:MAG: hypothetical protein DMD81_14845 [Candidatus Rokuibacteriota bacterium]|nr:MAG: hypothetical protein DMD81_14845 [Candidatus Rokubacteria bacterium]